MRTEVELDRSVVEEQRALVESGQEPEQENWYTYCHEKYHHEPITGMDICLRKQLVVTVSAHEIKVWNFENMSLEIETATMSSEEISAVAFHPSGFHIIVAFAG